MHVRNYQNRRQTVQSSRRRRSERRKAGRGKGAEVVFDEVLAIVNDGEVTVGKPFIDGAKVTATVEEQGKGEKILVFKYRAKVNYRKRAGHRQPFTAVKISGIQA